MPYSYEWHEPELFMEHRSIKIYHCYKNDDVDLKMSDWYVVENDDNDYSDTSDWRFDVRDLPGLHNSEDHKAVIIKAIDAEHITEYGFMGGGA